MTNASLCVALGQEGLCSEGTFLHEKVRRVGETVLAKELLSGLCPSAELPRLLRPTSLPAQQTNVLLKAESSCQGKPVFRRNRGSSFQFVEFWLWRESSTWQAAGESMWVTTATSDHGLAPFPARDGWANGNEGSRRVNKALLRKPNKEFMEWNDNGELSNNILWDGSKAVISGKLIQP